MLKRLIRKHEDHEEGFTLIELMVVVLILGILMAIAIPTFLSTKGSAQDAGAKSNASNALTAEKTVFGDTQAYTTGAASLDANLPWAAAVAKGKVVATAADSNLVVEISSESDSTHCFYVYDSQDTAAGTSYPAGTAYEYSATCAAPTWTAVAPTQGSAMANPGAWYTEW